MKSSSLAVLLLLNVIKANKLIASNTNTLNIGTKDIFDAYDKEARKEREMKDSEDNIDPVALAKEIGGSQIKKEVMQATAGVADQIMLQLDSRINIDEDAVYVPSADIYVLQGDITDVDGDGVEDNVKMSSHELDKFYKPPVFKSAEEMHNTRNGELPGHHLKEDHPVPGIHSSEIINGDTGVPIVQEHVQLRMDNAIDVNADILSSNEYDQEYNSIPTDMQEPINQERADLAEKFSTDPAPMPKVQPQVLAQQKVEQAAEVKKVNDEAQEAAIAQEALNERADSDYDESYIQTRFSDYVNTIQGPEDLELVSLGWERGNNAITDSDGDGVEDNIYWVSSEYDKYYKPAVFGVSEDIYNTRHGGLPGHRQVEHSKGEGEYNFDPTRLVKDDYWNKLGTTPGGI